MKNRNETQKIIAAVFLLAILSVASGAKSDAQTTFSKILLTWQATTYAPAAFEGKVLPGPGSAIYASADVIQNGKLVDMSREQIYWYLDDEFLDGGLGKQTISFEVPLAAPDFAFLSVQLPDYTGHGGSLFTNSVRIPIARPETVIESPYPENKFSGTQVRIFGEPYFFNVSKISDLNFLWSVNGKNPPGSESPTELVININTDAPAKSQVGVSLLIQDPKDLVSSASDILSLILVK